MNALHDWLTAPQTIRLGMTLIHFLWQGTLLGIVALVLMRLMKQASSHTRYLALLAVFCGTVHLPVITFVTLPSSTAVADPLVSITGSHVGADGPTNLVRQPERNKNAAKPELQAVPTASGVTTIGQGRPDWMAPLWRGIDDYIIWFVAAWGIGVCLCSLRLVLGLQGASRVRRVGLNQAPELCRTMCLDLMGCLRVNRVVRVFESTLVEVPVVVGWLRPLILLPATALTGLPEAQLRAILAHELAHVRRHDYLVNVFQMLVETLLFYHPVVWWLSATIRQEREQCCDDLAAEVCGDKIVVARALARLVELRSMPTHTAVAATGGKVGDRIRRLLVGDRELQHRSARWSAGGSLVALLIVIAAGLSANTLLGDSADKGSKAKEPSLAETPAKVAAEAAPPEAKAPEAKPAAVEGFKVTLSDGAQVELLGIGQHPHLGKNWWQADGTPLAEPFDQITLNSDEVLEFFKKRGFVEVAVGHTLPLGASARLSIHSGPSWSGQGGTKYLEHQIRGSYVVIPEDEKSTAPQKMTVRIEYSAGDWQTLAAADIDGNGPERRVDVYFAPLAERNNMLIAAITHSPLKHELRIVAVDKAGTIHIGEANSRENGDKVVEDRCRFRDLTLEDVAEVRLEFRRTQLIEFRNVPTTPGDKPAVEITLDGKRLASAPAAKPDNKLPEK